MDYFLWCGMGSALTLRRENQALMQFLTVSAADANVAWKSSQQKFPESQGPKRWQYSEELMKALTISALTKLPLNWLSLVSQKL